MDEVTIFRQTAADFRRRRWVLKFVLLNFVAQVVGFQLPPFEIPGYGEIIHYLKCVVVSCYDKPISLYFLFAMFCLFLCTLNCNCYSYLRINVFIH